MIVVLALFLLVRAGEITGHLPVLASSYADDFLCIPLILGAILWVQRRVFKQGPSFVLPPFHGLITLAFFAIYFEGILPHWTGAAVSDLWDLLMYLIGYFVFEKWLNKPSKKVKNCCHPKFV